MRIHCRATLVTLSLAIASFSIGNGPFEEIAWAQSANSKTVLGKFRKARSLFELDKLSDATLVLRDILKRYPDHLPSVELYAKSLYRLGKAKDALPLFQRLKLSMLDVESRYEYGQVYYLNGKFSGSLKAFQTIPEMHPLYDLANYYGAICAVRIRKYETAQQMLKRAVVLPEKLVKSKIQYSQHVAELLVFMKKRSADNQRVQEPEVVRQRKLADAMTRDAKAVQQEVKQTAGKFQHRGFQTVTQSALLGTERRRQDQSFHGYASKASETSELYFSFSGGPLVPLTGNDQTIRRAALGLELSTRLTQRVQSGTETRNVILESEPDFVVYFSQANRSLGKNAQVSAKGWLEWPVLRSSWLGAGASLFYLFPDFERPNRTGSRSVYSAMGWKNDTFHVNATVSYQESVDTDDDVEVTKLHADLTGGIEVQSTLTIDIATVYEQFTYQNNDLDGPDSSVRLETTVNQVLPLSLNVGARGVLELQSGNLLHDLPSYGTVSADGQLLTGEIYFSATPWSWIDLGMAQMWTSSNWSVTPDVAQDVYERNVVDLLSDSRVYVSVNLLF